MKPIRCGQPKYGGNHSINCAIWENDDVENIIYTYILYFFGFFLYEMFIFISQQYNNEALMSILGFTFYFLFSLSLWNEMQFKWSIFKIIMQFQVFYENSYSVITNLMVYYYIKNSITSGTIANRFNDHLEHIKSIFNHTFTWHPNWIGGIMLNIYLNPYFVYPFYKK